MERLPELKMWLAVRKDLTMPPEKLAAQAGHAFSETLMAARDAEPDVVAAYRATSHAKIVVWARNLVELERVRVEAIAAGIPCVLIVDEGRTVFGGPTATVCAFGPRFKADLPPFLNRLRLMETKPKPLSEAVP